MPNEEVLSGNWIERIEELVRRAEQLPDAQARSLVVELLQAVMDLHAAGLGRILEIAASAGEAGERIMASVAADTVSSSVLLLHGLHPDHLETRIDRAVEKLRMHFGTRGGSISLIGVQNGVIHLRFDGTSQRSAAAARETIEGLLYEAAPEIEDIVIDGLEKPALAGFVPLASLLAGQAI